MASTDPSLIATSQPIIQNSPEPNRPLIAINISSHSTIKLTTTNYLSWKLQFHATLIGYNLDGYVDGSIPVPPSTITTDGTTSPNPALQTWVRQDKLIFSAMVGSLSPAIVPLLNCATTSRDAWLILENTYAKPTRGHIKQIKEQLKNPIKGSRTISEYMHFIRGRVDELTIMGKPYDEEDLIEKVLDGLDEEYKSIIDAVNDRDTPIFFDELHEKLLNKETTLCQSQPLQPASFPATANPTSATFRTKPWRPLFNSSPYPHHWPSSNPPRPERTSPRPYLGTCQACNTQGHTAKRCTQFRLISTQPNSGFSPTAPRSSGYRPTSPQSITPWQPRVNYTTTGTSNTPSWLLDSGASHHVTTDQENLSLHAPYHAHDDVMIGDGMGLQITHTGSTSLHSSKRPKHRNHTLDGTN